MTIRSVFAGVVVAGLGGGIYAIFMNLDGDGSRVGPELAEMAASANARLPIMVDAGTRLDSMRATSDDTLEYHYTLVDLQSSRIDRDAFEHRLASQLMETVCTVSGTEVFRIHGVNMVYTYYGTDGEQVGSVVIPTAECAASARRRT